MAEILANILFGVAVGLAVALVVGLAYVAWTMARETPPDPPTHPPPPAEPPPGMVAVRLARGPVRDRGPVVDALGDWYCPACLDVRREGTREHVPTPAGAMVYCRHHLRMLSVLYAEQDGSGERWWTE